MKEAKPINVKRSDIYDKWLKELKDPMARARILSRTKRLEKGNPGDVEPVGEGVSEMRINYGPGYRVYYKEFRKIIIILLCGGDKHRQQVDIEEAKRIAKLYEKEYKNEK
jgi:putative addiction module killer protein